MTPKPSETALDLIPEEHRERIKQEIEGQMAFLNISLIKAQVGERYKLRVLEIHRRRLQEEYARGFRGAIEAITAHREDEEFVKQISPPKYTPEILVAVKDALISKFEVNGHSLGALEITLDEQTLHLLSEFYLNKQQESVDDPNSNLRKLFEGRIHAPRRGIVDIAIFIAQSLTVGTITAQRICELSGYEKGKVTDTNIAQLQRGENHTFKLNDGYLITGNSKAGWKLDRVK